MATQEALQCITIPAKVDLSASQYCFVRIDNTATALLPTAGGDVVGVLQNKPSVAGHAAEIAYAGRAKVYCSADVAAGVKVQVDTAGKVLTALTGDHVVGTVLVGGTNGQLVEVLLGSQMLLP